MSLHLHGYWRSSASYRVRIALNLKKLPYTYVPVHLVKDGGQQKTAEYQGLNPAMLVPTFVDDDEDVTLNQSLAIIEYLDEKYPSDIQFLPSHTLDRARIRMLSYDIACDIQPLCNLRVLNTLKQNFAASNDMTDRWIVDLIYKGFVALEKRLLSRAGKYAYGYTVTMADICLVPQVYNALRYKVDMAKFPIINKVYKNCQLLAPFEAAIPESQPDAF